MIFRVFFLALTFFSFLLGAKPPELNPATTKAKIEEILREHATQHALNGELIKRSFESFLEYLDPSKTYFIEHEVAEWTNPSQELLEKTLLDYTKNSFSTYKQMYQVMQKAIKRRNEIEKQIKTCTPPTGVTQVDFKDLKWAASEEELKDRILKIKGMQLETINKLDDATKDGLFQRLENRRHKKEMELSGSSKQSEEESLLLFVLKSICSALDAHTFYFTPHEASQFIIQVQQRLFGIGAQLRDDLSGITVVRIIEGSPAAQENKLKIGDKIIAVGEESIIGMDLSDSVELIRGPQDTVVTLTILRKDTEETEVKHRIDITRGEIVLKEGRSECSYEPFGDGVIGVLKLFSFYQDQTNSSASDLSAAITKLKKEHNLKGVILDLRNNPGGLLPQAASVAGLFMKKGVVVSVKDNTGAIQKLRNSDPSPVWDGPLIILTNRISASAAEIVAQSLKEYGRALVVGDSETFGKGTFQKFTLEALNSDRANPLGEYKVTRGRYYTVGGKSPQLTGVVADIVVPGIFSQMEIGEKYSKFPLETDTIPASFDDDFSDYPALYRDQVKRFYRFNLQKLSTEYEPYFERLKKNSQERILLNQPYQSFIKAISKKDFSSESVEIFGQTDPQLDEAVKIMKDLLILMMGREKKVAA